MNKIRKLFFSFDDDMNISERLFKIVLFIAFVMALFCIIECVLVELNVRLILFFTAFLGVIVLCSILTFKYHRLDAAAIIMGFVCIVFVFPVTVFYGGGIAGGSPLWLAAGLIYIFVMFSGKKLSLFLLLSIVVDAAVYVYAYKNPDCIHELASQLNLYADSLFSVITVGIGIGVIFKIQVKMFEQERSVNIQQKNELQNSNNARNAFFANMSHEIRTPISSIIGLNEMIRRSNPSDEIAEYTANIEVASKMLLNLVNDVLDMTQMEMKKMEIISVEYSTKDLFIDLIDMIQVQIKAKKLILLVDIDRNIPSKLLGDEKRIKQVVLNLLTNAVKYTPGGSVTISVRSEIVGPNKANLRISVADTGIGIKKEDLLHLYDSFRRLDTQKNKRIEGSGLGLSITKQLVDLMNGELTVDSIYTKGSTFTVSFEQGIVDHAPIGNVDFFKVGAKDNYEYKPSFEAPEAHVLIVDDNRMNTLVERKLLEKTKVKVDIAESGEECLEMTQKKFYHVILMDYMMSGLNGAETLQKLRSQENGLCKESAVIILTANTVEDARFLCEKYGFDGYLEKPISGQKLENEIVKLIPEDILEIHDQDTKSSYGSERVRKLSASKKRRRVIITTDCVSDLPESIISDYEIKVMYLYIRTENGRFADTLEIDSDNISQYMNNGYIDAKADSVTVEEYEEFFADALTEADHVIHISMAASAGRTYDMAVTAAQGFDHVQVIDSGHISGGEGLMVLYAAKMAAGGYKAEDIYEAVKRKKDNISSTFLLPDAKAISSSKYIKKEPAAFMSLFNLHLIMQVRNSKMSLRGICAGPIQRCRQRLVARKLMFKGKIDKEMLIITHVNCSYQELYDLKETILRRVPFDKVIINKASFSNACNAGVHAIGISYYEKEV